MASKDTNQTPQPREQWAKQSDAHRTDFERAEKPLKYQLAAWVLWIVGIAVVVGATLCASGGVNVPVLTTIPALTIVLAVVIDLIVVLLAQRCWRKASALGGSRSQGAVGVAMACFAFAPMAIFFLMAKNASGKIKATAVVAAVLSIVMIVVICLVCGGPEAVPEA